jgi:uncharacterized protein (DUF433 family)
MGEIVTSRELKVLSASDHPRLDRRISLRVQCRPGYPELRRQNMATLDWSQCPVVESVPDRLNGAWVFRETRMPVSAVFENLEAGATVDQIVEWFDIEKDRVIEVLEFAARSVAAPAIPEKTTAHDAHPV